MKTPRAGKPCREQDKLPEHITRVNVTRPGMPIDVSHPTCLLIKDVGELPPDPIGDPDMGVRVSAALDRVVFLQQLAKAIYTRQDMLKDLSAIVAIHDPSTASQIRHVATESQHCCEELSAHIVTLLNDILSVPARSGANHNL